MKNASTATGGVTLVSTTDASVTRTATITATTASTVTFTAPAAPWRERAASHVMVTGPAGNSAAVTADVLTYRTPGEAAAATATTGLGGRRGGGSIKGSGFGTTSTAFSGEPADRRAGAGRRRPCAGSVTRRSRVTLPVGGASGAAASIVLLQTTAGARCTDHRCGVRGGGRAGWALAAGASATGVDQLGQRRRVHRLRQSGSRRTPTANTGDLALPGTANLYGAQGRDGVAGRWPPRTPRRPCRLPAGHAWARYPG